MSSGQYSNSPNQFSGVQPFNGEPQAAVGDLSGTPSQAVNNAWTQSGPAGQPFVTEQPVSAEGRLLNTFTQPANNVWTSTNYVVQPFYHARQQPNNTQPFHGPVQAANIYGEPPHPAQPNHGASSRSTHSEQAFYSPTTSNGYGQHPLNTAQFNGVDQPPQQVNGAADNAVCPGPFCSNCGRQVDPRAIMCLACGSPIRKFIYNEKSRLAAGILAILFGGFGIHKFYMGRIGMGILYLVFSWTFIPGFIALIEGVIYLCESDAKFANRLH